VTGAYNRATARLQIEMVLLLFAGVPGFDHEVRVLSKFRIGNVPLDVVHVGQPRYLANNRVAIDFAGVTQLVPPGGAMVDTYLRVRTDGVKAVYRGKVHVR